MPYRTTPLINKEIYHIVNRGVDHRNIFTNHYDYKRATELISYYQFANLPFKYSRFIKLSNNQREEIVQNMKKGGIKHVSLICFCLMPNHFHMLVKQEQDNGISKFLANFQNSYTKYFNTKNKRSGHLVQGQFKAVRIANENQLLHTSRYIHLNPYTAYIVKNVKELQNYKWSSLSQYMEENKKEICDTKEILTFFKSSQKYLEFVLDQKDYQRALGNIKHILLE